MCHDGARHFFEVVHPDHVDSYPGRPNDQVPPWARLLPITDSAGSPLTVKVPDSFGLDELGGQIRDANENETTP
jgi:hypothetical protein